MSLVGIGYLLREWNELQAARHHLVEAAQAQQTQAEQQLALLKAGPTEEEIATE